MASKLLAVVRKPPPRRLCVVCAARPLKTGKMKQSYFDILSLVYAFLCIHTF